MMKGNKKNQRADSVKVIEKIQGVLVIQKKNKAIISLVHKNTLGKNIYPKSKKKKQEISAYKNKHQEKRNSNIIEK